MTVLEPPMSLSVGWGQTLILEEICKDVNRRGASDPLHFLLARTSL